MKDFAGYNMALQPRLFFPLATLAVLGAIYGVMGIETGKLNPLEQLKVNRANVELRRKEANTRYNQAVYGLFREDGYGLADLNKDGKISLEELTKSLRVMGVSEGSLESAFKTYQNSEANRIKEK